MYLIFSIPLTGKNSILDWGLWIAVIVLASVILSIYLKRWIHDEREIIIRKNKERERDDQ